jgi:hypothetical protein
VLKRKVKRNKTKKKIEEHKTKEYKRERDETMTRAVSGESESGVWRK